LLALCALVWLRYGAGLGFSDDFAYVQAALDANDKGWLHYLFNISTIYENRPALVLPLAAYQSVFGRSELAVQALGLSFSAGAVGFTFAIGRRLAGEWAGWLAALLIASIPQVAWFSTSLLPDTASPFYLSGALYAALRAQLRELDAKAGGWYALAAFFVFCTFESRAPGGLALVVLGFLGLCQPRHRLLRALLPGVFFSGMVLAFWSLLALGSSEFGIQLRMFALDATAWTEGGKPFQSLYFMLPAVRVLTELPQLIGRAAPWTPSDLAHYAVNTLLGLHYYLVWPAVIYACFRWRSMPAVRLPLVAFLVFYAYFEFGVTNLRTFQLIWKNERYLSYLNVSSALVAGVVGGGLLQRAFTRRWQRLAFSVTAVLYIAVDAALLEANKHYWGDPVASLKSTFEHVKPIEGVDVIYVPGAWWQAHGRVLLRLEPARRLDIRLLDGATLDELHHAAVVVDRSFVEGWSRNRDAESHLDPRLAAGAYPAHWQLQFTQPALSMERRRYEILVFLAR
jgi:4-amino-4-deoxy-L-arabinose transferase-like glycosyltransferase